MSTSTLKEPGIAGTIFSQQYPIAFRILNEKHEEKIYLEDKPSSGLLELTNTSDDIYLAPANESQIAGPENFHFALKFRPGILKTTAKALIENKLIKKGWVLTIGLESLITKAYTDPGLLKDKSEETLNEYISILYFLNTNETKIEKGESIILPLKHLHLKCDEGTQVTRVELECNNLTHDSTYETRIGKHIRHYNLTIVNHRGSPTMPLHIGFTGFNAILNDGFANQLSLRITNLQKKEPDNKGTFTISRKKHSRMYVYFITDIQPNDFALGTPNNVSEIELSFLIPAQKKESSLVHEPFFQGDTPIWEIYPEGGDVVLQPHLTRSGTKIHGLPDDSCMDIVIKDIDTKFPMGVTYMYLRFENIPGYWDHTYTIPILKQPLIFIPTFDLLFEADITVSYESIKRSLLDNKIPEQKIPVAIKTGTVIQTQLFRDEAERLEQSLRAIGVSVSTIKSKDERIGIGTSRPKNKLSVNVNADFTGNVGIGTAVPLGPLSIGDSSIANSDGYLVIGKKNSTGGTRHFRIGFDESFNFRIGDYGNNNQAATWKSPFAIAYNAPDNSVIIKNDGKVGIGTNAPLGTLSIGDSSIANSDGHLVIGKKNSTGGTRHFRIGFDESFNFKIGDYGNNNQAATWRSPFAIAYNAPDNSVIIKSDGKVGIGTDQPKQKVEIGANGGLGFSGSGLNSADKKLYSPADGDLEWMTHDWAGTHGFAVSHQGQKKVYLNTLGHSYINGGNVGIGTTDPVQGKLVVNGSVNYNIPTYFWMNKFMTGLNPPPATVPASIYATNRIICDEFNAISDKRIKNIKGRSDSASDLQTLLNIEITDYSYKDVLSKGNKLYKKVIAQQVKDVYPTAIKEHEDAVPDIYQPAIIENGWIKLETDLAVGEKVQLIFGSERKVFDVLETKASAFRVSVKKEGDVFVYGRHVDDVLSVDYEAISMLNVSATQELVKQIELLRSENQKLKDEQHEIKKKIAAIKEMLKTPIEF